MSETIKLNIGAGPTRLEGWTAIDRKLGSEAYPLKDYADNSVDEIRASHILEHFGHNEVPLVLKEWSRVLKPGGRMRIAVPDVEKVMELRSKGDELWRGYMMGGQTNENDYHRTVFDYDALNQMMDLVGLVNIRIWESDNTDTASHPCSLRLEGTKSDTDKPAVAVEDQPVDVKIKALMSLPRYGANASRGCIEQTLHTFGIPCAQHGGAYWSHTLQSALEDFVTQGIDWALIFDHDTLCTPQHLDTMFGAFGNDPSIDALAALQCKRHGDFPLLTIKGEQQIATDGSPLEVDTAHFGMTLLRCKSLKRVPLPWFWELPTIRGGWRDPSKGEAPEPQNSELYDQHAQPPEGIPVDPLLLDLWRQWDYPGRDSDAGDYHIDADIWFWKQWKRAGNTVFVHPNVRVGHLEEVVVDFDTELKPRHQYPYKWIERNRHA